MVEKNSRREFIKTLFAGAVGGVVTLTASKQLEKIISPRDHLECFSLPPCAEIEGESIPDIIEGNINDYYIGLTKSSEELGERVSIDKYKNVIFKKTDESSDKITKFLFDMVGNVIEEEIRYIPKGKGNVEEDCTFRYNFEDGMLTRKDIIYPNNPEKSKSYHLIHVERNDFWRDVMDDTRRLNKIICKDAAGNIKWVYTRIHDFGGRIEVEYLYRNGNDKPIQSIYNKYDKRKATQRIISEDNKEMIVKNYNLHPKRFSNNWKLVDTTMQKKPW